MNSAFFRRAAGAAAFAALMVLLVPAGPVAAKKTKYKEAPVANGGTLKGVIKLAGAPPKAKRIKVTKDKKICGDFLLDESLTVSGGGGIANAVIEIGGIKKGKKWNLPAVFSYDQKKCAFTPHVMLVRPRAKGTVKNSDKVKHNFHTISKRVFNINKSVAAGKTLKVKKNKIKKAGKVRVKCDLHKWMGGWWIVPESPYAALSDGKGGYEITGVPPGTYQVAVWQERLGRQVKEVTIKAGAVTTLNITMQLK